MIKQWLWDEDCKDHTILRILNFEFNEKNQLFILLHLPHSSLTFALKHLLNVCEFCV